MACEGQGMPKDAKIGDNLGSQVWPPNIVIARGLFRVLITDLSVLILGFFGVGSVGLDSATFSDFPTGGVCRDPGSNPR